MPRNTHFPKQRSGPKPSHWRHKVKYCAVCGKSMSNMPKSIFLRRTCCSRSCKNKHVKYKRGGHKGTNARLIFGYYLASVIQDNTDWDWFECCIEAVSFMKGR